MSNALMLADLKRSGLTAADASKAGYKALTTKQVADITGNHAAGYLITYYDVSGKKTDYYRVRYTEEVKGAFGSAKKKPLRYTGPANKVPRFYFPKRVSWKKLSSDVSETLIITEGEKKAEKACKEGLPCFSIPGVWAWRSKKAGLPSIPDFDLIDWKARRVILCFDNDLMTNPQVIAALNALAHELTGRGAVAAIKYLPKKPGKIGLDDYLVKHKPAAFIRLHEEPFKESSELWALNERLAFVDKLKAIYDFETKVFYKSKPDLLFSFADKTYMVEKAKGDGFKEKNAAEDWLKWKHKRRYTDIEYAPGEGETVGNNVNMWLGYGCEPKKGNVKPYRDLLNFLFEGEDDLRQWFEQWLAYPLQHPGTKNLTAVLLHSTAHGIGKSFIGYLMGEIYGANFVVIDHEAMNTNYNGYVVNRQFILGEEITGGNSRSAADRLKNMITREKIHVNIKYEPEYDIQDLANYLLTSNHVDALYLEDDDRRAVVHTVNGDVRPFAFYKAIDIWRTNGGGVCAVLSSA